jgi:hypothetical protein
MADSWPLPKKAVPVAIAILEAAFPTLTVSDEIPEPRPARFLVVSRTGGTQPAQHQDRPRILVECWAKDSDTAEQMTTTARQALRNARASTFGGVWVYCWENEQGPVDLNDPDIQDRRRCQFHGDLLLSTDD